MTGEAIIAAVVFISGIIFGAGGFYVSVLYKLAKNQGDLTGVANLSRGIDKKVDRNYLHMIATSIDASHTLDEARLYAKLLREAAWEI